MWCSAPSVTVCTKPPKGENGESFLWCFPEVRAHGASHPVAVTPLCTPTRARPCGGGYSLVAPVQAGGDVTLHVLHPVMGEVPHQHLPPQIQDFIHDMPQSVEEITFISLGNTQMYRFSGQTLRHGVTTEEQRPRPVYPLCAGHSEDRLCINKLSPRVLKHTHFSAPSILFHNAALLPKNPNPTSLLRLAKTHIISQDPHDVSTPECGPISDFTFSTSLSTSNPLFL